MLGLALALALTAAPAGGPILLDGACSEPAWSDAETTPIGEGLELKAMADADYLFLCIPLPPQSLGTLDLYIDSGSGAPVNLHVSAQTGERTRGEEGWPEWSGFNNYDRWYGPPVAFAGFTAQSDGTRALTFADSAARELQLDRSRFGGDVWRVALQLRALNADQTGTLDYPVNADIDDSSTWAELTLP
ncbi:MAG: hypothetical protein AB7P07_07720 [Hyphomonadaceae bacterium]